MPKRNVTFLKIFGSIIRHLEISLMNVLRLVVYTIALITSGLLVFLLPERKEIEYVVNVGFCKWPGSSKLNMLASDKGGCQ